MVNRLEKVKLFKFENYFKQKYIFIYIPTIFVQLYWVIWQALVEQTYGRHKYTKVSIKFEEQHFLEPNVTNFRALCNLHAQHCLGIVLHTNCAGQGCRNKGELLWLLLL